ncbi:glycine-rich domain-containing protein [Thiomonas sp.]
MHKRRRALAIAAVLGLFAAGMAAAGPTYEFRTLIPGAKQLSVTETFAIPGTYTVPVPSGATRIAFQLAGAGGGGGYFLYYATPGTDFGGNGGLILGTVSVAGVSSVTVVVGAGGQAGSGSVNGGFGGGASALVLGGQFVAVAGGGGGGGLDNSVNPQPWAAEGGPGGESNTSGENVDGAYYSGCAGGAGATDTGPGIDDWTSPGYSGTGVSGSGPISLTNLTDGGNGSSVASPYGVADPSGGSGYYGGGSGYNCGAGPSGAGGGSDYAAPEATGVTDTVGGGATGGLGSTTSDTYNAANTSLPGQNGVVTLQWTN